MKMRRVFFGVTMALIFLLALTPTTLAQDPNRLAQLKISIWPEYDQQPSHAQPIVLVLMQATLADKSNLPRQVSVLIPSDAEFFVATWENPDGSLAPEQPVQQVKQDDGLTRVTFTTTQPKFWVEYYHNALRGAPDKTMDFSFKALAPVDELTLEFQQPARATNFAVTSGAPNTRQGTDGFKYFSTNPASLAAGQTVAAQIKYTKTDLNPSVQIQAPPSQLPTTVPATPTPSTFDSTFLLIALVVLGLAAVFGFLLWRQRAGEIEPETSKMSAKQFQRQRRRARGTPSEASVFCTQCGNAMDADDNFCPKCGAERRVG